MLRQAESSPVPGLMGGKQQELPTSRTDLVEGCIRISYPATRSGRLHSLLTRCGTTVGSPSLRVANDRLSLLLCVPHEDASCAVGLLKDFFGRRLHLLCFAEELGDRAA